MTRDQNGTWELESNDNFEGLMKALGKGVARGGKGGGGGKGRGRALWSSPDLCASLTPRSLPAV